MNWLGTSGLFYGRLGALLGQGQVLILGAGGIGMSFQQYVGMRPRSPLLAVALEECSSLSLHQVAGRVK